MIYSIAKIFQAITYWPIYLLLKFFVCFEVNGQENLKGLENKAIIFASNHTSYIDGPICAAAMPRNGFYPKDFFPIRFLAMEKYFKWYYLIVALYVWINGSIKIFKAGGDLEKALADTIKALENNNRVWIYPEGGITKDGSIRSGKRGIAYLHQRTGAPIVPVCLNGTFKILSFKTLFFAKKVKINIGKPIYSLSDLTLEEGTDKIMSEISKLKNIKEVICQL